MPHQSLQTLLPLLSLILALAPGCAQDIGFADADDSAGSEDGADGDGDGDSGRIATETEAGVSATVVDATDEAEWVYLDLDTGSEVDASGPWDLGFRRFEIIVNGGINGELGVEASIVEDATLADVEAVPADATWITDAADANDDGEPELAWGDWYDYDPATHVLVPKPRVYLIRSSELAVFAIDIDDYYSQAGTAGTLQFHWMGID